SMSWSFVRVRSRKTENIRLIHVTAEDSPEVGMPEYYQRFDSVRYIRENYLKRMDLLDRLSEVIERRPAKLFVEAGINDIGQGVPLGMIAGNIGSIVQYVRVKSPETRVYV